MSSAILPQSLDRDLTIGFEQERLPVSSFGGWNAGDDADGTTVRVRVCDEDDIPIGRYRCYREGDLSYLVCNVKGVLHAIINQCSHMRVPLDGGRQFGKDFICPLHGARFDIATGKALTGPAVARLKTYPVSIEGGAIFVELPAAAIRRAG
jgi:nitrite reductase/ring-hydroxylating ferredoxin subunit